MYQPYQGQQKQIHSLQEIYSLVCVCYYPHKHCSSAYRLGQDHLWFSQGAPVSYHSRAYCKEIHFILSLHCQVSVLLTSIVFTANLGDLINPYWFILMLDFSPNRKVVIVWTFFLRFLVRLFKSSRWWCSNNCIERNLIQTKEYDLFYKTGQRRNMCYDIQPTSKTKKEPTTAAPAAKRKKWRSL